MFVILILVGVAYGDRMILRPNYGVLFEKIGVIDNGASYWKHTFAIPWFKFNSTFNYQINIPCTQGCLLSKKNCEQPNCLEFQDHAKEYNNIVKYSESRLNLLIQSVDKLFPTKTNNRIKRGFLNFIGDISSSLFGTATEADVNVLKKHINILEKQGNLEMDKITHVDKELHSLIHKTNDRVTNIIKAVNINRNDIVTMNQMLAKVVIRGEVEWTLLNLRLNYLTKFVKIMFRQSTYFKEIEMLAQTWLNGLQTLLDGYLPFHFVSATDISMVINEVQSVLQNSYPAFRVVHTQPGYYYKVKDLT